MLTWLPLFQIAGEQNSIVRSEPRWSRDYLERASSKRSYRLRSTPAIEPCRLCLCTYAGSVLPDSESPYRFFRWPWSALRWSAGQGEIWTNSTSFNCCNVRRAGQPIEIEVSGTSDRHGNVERRPGCDRVGEGRQRTRFQHSRLSGETRVPYSRPSGSSSGFPS